ncbi:hypothetical protein SK128_005950 [Halocaridina rubra]|uniref:Uncharacterized protein n=1 Tax=Halocaridina rubra TaxID=373956 RepID=A0AAN9AFB2_HALRR
MGVSGPHTFGVDSDDKFNSQKYSEINCLVLDIHKIAVHRKEKQVKVRSVYPDVCGLLLAFFLFRYHTLYIEGRSGDRFS